MPLPDLVAYVNGITGCLLPLTFQTPWRIVTISQELFKRHGELLRCFKWHYWLLPISQELAGAAMEKVNSLNPKDCKNLQEVRWRKLMEEATSKIAIHFLELCFSWHRSAHIDEDDLGLLENGSDEDLELLEENVIALSGVIKQGQFSSKKYFK
ncbi:hypothetical protein L1987_35028 [Smallanthus sonchifolius]|uniref:Uncharacterized protein n=1 Tax=Smallanthus sonchifolius TaxID=185202 RepID=A0ACB9HWN2_9ASTR|nr:hypothetical protein L1987_35028 [Smallanthus sonchifolius]